MARAQTDAGPAFRLEISHRSQSKGRHVVELSGEALNNVAYVCVPRVHTECASLPDAYPANLLHWCRAGAADFQLSSVCPKVNDADQSHVKVIGKEVDVCMETSFLRYPVCLVTTMRTCKCVQRLCDVAWPPAVATSGLGLTATRLTRRLRQRQGLAWCALLRRPYPS